MTLEQKELIKNRCENNNFYFDDIEVHKRDILSYVRELGFEPRLSFTNLDKNHFEWKDYKSIILDNKHLGLAKVVRELRKYVPDFAKRTFRYKLKECGLKDKELRGELEYIKYIKSIDWKLIDSCDNTDEAYELLGMTYDIPKVAPYMYSISELCTKYKVPLHIVSKYIVEGEWNKRQYEFIKYINNTSFPLPAIYFVDLVKFYILNKTMSLSQLSKEFNISLEVAKNIRRILK